MSEYHQPVMLQECIEGLAINPDGVYVDVTFGGGGHSREILKKLSHNNIIKYFSSNIDMSNGNQIYCIKMEYCNYGDLYTVLKKQSKDKQMLSDFKLRNTLNLNNFNTTKASKFLFSNNKNKILKEICVGYNESQQCNS